MITQLFILLGTDVLVGDPLGILDISENVCIYCSVEYLCLHRE